MSGIAALVFAHAVGEAVPPYIPIGGQGGRSYVSADE